MGDRHVLRRLRYNNVTRQAVYVCHIEMWACNHCCSGKAISITYSECAFIALGIQQAVRMHHIVTGGLPGCTVFFHIFSYTERIKEVIEHEMCVLIFSTKIYWNISRSKRIERDIIKNVYWSSKWSTRYSCQILMKLEFSLILGNWPTWCTSSFPRDFYLSHRKEFANHVGQLPRIITWCMVKKCKILNFLDRFSKNTQISWKYDQHWTEVFSADRRTDRRITISKEIVSFRNFANAPKNWHLRQVWRRQPC
jgi:hypothetical protein